MSSGAKRLVQSLRGRSGGGGGGGSSRSGSTRSESHDGGAGGAAASTSATRLFHYDSGHELDEISVIARGADDITTPTTPYHHYGPAQVSVAVAGGGQLRYGSGQTLYSIAGSVPPAPAAPLSRVTPAGIVTPGGTVVSGGELRERHRMGRGGRGEDDTNSVENISSRGGVLPSRQSLLDLVSGKLMGRHTPTYHYYHHQQQQRYFSSSRDSLQGSYVNRGSSELDLSHKNRRKDHFRGKFKLPNAVLSSSSNTTARDATPSHLHTPASINHLTGTSTCNGTETELQYRRFSSMKLLRYTAAQQQAQRGSRGYPGQSGQVGYKTGAPNWSFVFDPAGRLCYYWSMVVSLAFLYNFWVIIYRFAFQEINGETLMVWFCLDYLSDFLYLIDIVFHFRTGYLEDGVLQTDATKLRTHYMNSTTFYIDCLCLLPLDCLYLSIGFNSILRSFRLVKIYRFWAFMDRTERHTNYPNLFRSTSLIHYLLVIFHWNGCLYHIIYKNNGFGSKNWVFSDSETADVVKQYLQSYYWCTLALTTIGDLPRPRSKGEYLFVIGQLLFGLLLFATVLGHVANIVTSVSASRKEFQAKLDGVKTYMRMRRVPSHLQVKVIKWFDYLWLTQKCSDEERAVSCLPDKLKAEIAINVHLDTLKRVEIFQNTEAGFLCELVLRLRPVLFSPGDYICRKGEVGKEMYIVNRGRLQVVADNGKTVLATLKAGSYFGEISILNMGTAGKECGNRRTASVRSVGYSDLFVLSKKDMWDVLKEYPAARVRLEAIAVKRLEKYKRAPLEKGMTCNSLTHLMGEGTTPLMGTEPVLEEIRWLRERLTSLESENLSLNQKLRQNQTEYERRLAEIEMQIARPSSASSTEDNERNRESFI
ncbi:cyclic nucleotide-gated cation channel alpha-3 isoform X5 [Phymastichus coffea]|uniref:cyclic nucleotide-gated cation channel alpha-3 isoform X5 n=1 Tax=Phymastichus coffea TaxID=108790 RepID=UPI00273AB149|nr:cyclic nucleotide-gated cation channel alpha-3 isoform X5 [Phymastichus coffea]